MKQHKRISYRTYALYKFIILCLDENTSFQALINYALINSDRLKRVEKSRFNAGNTYYTFGISCQCVSPILEETKPQPEPVQKPKGRQRKGCLYRYIENKKLKSGAFASYPRVIGHRQPDNPTHWRWGFNWEEKIDGEWKGRSIGSVPLGAIALIQSMQKEGVSLEEIIGFLRRAKSKKS